MKLRITLSLAFLVFSACQGPDYDRHRETVKDRLRDPDSASFRSEKVRTLWSKDGSRLTVYCAEVNANNLIGGKTGYKPLTLVVEAVNRAPNPANTVKNVWFKGRIFLNEEINPNYYLDCIRPDSERANGKLFVAYATMGRPWSEEYQAEIDQEVPAISTDSAPES